MSDGVLHVKLAQSDLAPEYAKDLDRHSRMIYMGVRDVVWFLQAVNGEIIEFELESREVPDEVLQLDFPSSHRFELADETAPHPVTERIAVQIKTEARHESNEHDADAELSPAGTARRFGNFLSHCRFYCCLAASAGPVICKGSVWTSEMSGVFLSSPESGNDGSKV